jgi:peptidoglycan/xylan/chitin deacetylase (PgdA/CDA1 family)
MHHTIGASQADIAEVARRIKDATGFRPCLFRPPYGAYDSTEVARARAEKMSLVTWNVDPTDWATPGADAIYQRVVGNVHSGSIVLMHDGGGNRSQTVEALPRIIATLHRRGYQLVTVSKLLGQKMVYRLDR